ncbi:MAG: hypothetical protein IID39_05645, partial [Planctomycetes bacterium]|nr:hypothetical protein [Planctomycetota bacterium]
MPMQVDELVQLVASGNTTTIEEKWMAVVERDGAPPDDVIALKPVLEALLERKQANLADSLAWAAVETLAEGESFDKALQVGRAFLLALPKSTELRKIVASLYEKVFGEREGFDALTKIAGIAEGRPPRRAMRVLDMCLAIKPGSYAVSREDGFAVRVDAIDTAAWRIALNHGNHSADLDALKFTDDFDLCDPDDYRVLLRFDRERLQTMLKKEPARILSQILIARDEA